MAKPTSTSIIIVILFATVGFTITAYFINNNIVQYTRLPEKISMKVLEGGDDVKDNVIFNLKVKSKFAIDTIGSATIATGAITEKNILYHQNPFFPVWGMLILIMVTIASASAPVFINQIAQLKKIFNLSGKQVATGVFFAVLIAAYVALSNSSGKGYYTPQKIIDDLDILLTKGNILNGIILSTIVLILPAMSVMMLIGPSSDKLFMGIPVKDDLKKAVKALEYLNGVLQNALQLLSIIVVFTVLTSSALRESIKATIQIEAFDIFPKEVSYVYGMFFSLFLCIMYIPVYLYLKRQYEYLNIMLAEAGESDESRQKIMSSVNLKNSTIDNLKMALTVLAPLLSSFLPENISFLQ